MSTEIIQLKSQIQEILIAGNRGPCGGVNMAIEATDQVLDIVGGREEVYIPWGIIHNRPVMTAYEKRGVVNFNLDWSKLPDGSIVINPAHGAPPSFFKAAALKNCFVVDVTCQFVNKVQGLARKAEEAGKHVLYVGVCGHPETEGVRGQVKPENFTLIEKIADLEGLAVPEGVKAITYSQTTLATREIRAILEKLRQNPSVEVPNRWDICYATDNRQEAVEKLANMVDSLVVVGSKHSHNSQMLTELGLKRGIDSHLVDYPEEMSEGWFKRKTLRVGVTSGASVPDYLTIPVVEWLRARSPEALVSWENQVRVEKRMTFKLPQSQIDLLLERYNLN